MESLEQNIRELVRGIVSEMKIDEAPKTAAPPPPAAKPLAGRAGVFPDIDSAVAAAQKAHLELMELSLETRKKIIEAMRETALANAESLSKKAEEETGFGRWRDKVMKNELVAVKTPGVEDIQASAYSDDNGLVLVERAPYGVICAIIPSTSPSSTVICNGIGMVAGGNSVVFGPHPMAKEVSAMAITVLNEAIVRAGGPENLLTCMAEPTIEAAGRMMKHPGVALLVVTGGPGVVKAAMNCGKKVIAAGPGNPPCVVDETAHIEKAGKDIVDGGSFDNNVVCICEKEVLVVESVADRLKKAMCANGAYELNKEQVAALTKIVIAEPGGPGREGVPNKNFVGKNASCIAREIGLDLPDSVRMLLCEVDKDHPLVWTEQLMPVMPLVRVTNVDEAILLAQRCEHGFRHTAIMHSMNIEKLSKMAKLMNCSIFIKNGPCYAGLGAGGAGFTSFTIASPTGEGLTRARTFTRERRCTLVDSFRIV